MAAMGSVPQEACPEEVVLYHRIIGPKYMLFISYCYNIIPFKFDITVSFNQQLVEFFSFF